MQRFLKLLLVVVFGTSLAATSAFAHAFLDHAVPGVGLTVNGPVHELRLWYTQGVVTAFSAVSVTRFRRGFDSGEQTGQRSVGPAASDRPSRARAGTWQLHGELARAFGRHAYDHGHVPFHGLLSRVERPLRDHRQPGLCHVINTRRNPAGINDSA